MEQQNTEIKRFFSILLSVMATTFGIAFVIPYWALVYPINSFFVDFLNLNENTANILTTLVFIISILFIDIYFTLKEFTSSFNVELIKQKEKIKEQLVNENNTIRNQIIYEANISKNKIENDVNNLIYQKEQLERQNNSLNIDINSKQDTIVALKSNVQSLWDNIDKIKSNTQQHLTKLNGQNTISYPWLAELYADIAYIEENKIADYLKHKKIPAIKASENISKISKEKRILQTQLKIAQNQLRYYETVFPWLEDFKEADPIEAYETLNSLYSDDEYSRIKNYLSPEEYQKLSSAEKYQLALDRWRNKPNKTAWQIGIDYERYIGYIYETKGYKVTYNGALKGLEDMGRDIIAENDKEILVVQCKYWKKEKTIHEKHIFQLYGTVVLEKMETKKKVKGVFITSAKLSETAMAVAKELKIDIQECIPFDKDYPCIKCNINHITGEKIYHLPFDQQYDRVQIESNKNEFYVKTTKEAEEGGFRHAFKHYINN